MCPPHLEFRALCFEFCQPINHSLTKLINGEKIMLHSGKNRWRRRILAASALLVAGITVILAGCYPGEITSVAEADLVITLYDNEANFAALKTYSMPDTIIHVCDVPEEEQSCPSELTRRYDDQILSQIRQNLESMGFTPAADPQQADVYVVVGANATDFTGYAYYGWWWGYYYPYYPGWGWYYPGYAVPYEYTTGTLLISMFDPDKADSANKRLGSVWLAAINGLLGEGGNAQTRLTTTINQAFTQSPYLGEGK
jgi:hypothetical protein